MGDGSASQPLVAIPTRTAPCNPISLSDWDPGRVPLHAMRVWPRRTILQGLGYAALGLRCAETRRTGPRRPAAWGVAGLGRPEALAVADGDIFVLDRGSRGITAASLVRVSHAEVEGLGRAVVAEPLGITEFGIEGGTAYWITGHGQNLRAAGVTRPELPRDVSPEHGGWRGPFAVMNGVVLACRGPNRALMAVTGQGVVRELDPGPVEALCGAGGTVVYARGGSIRVIDRIDGPARVLCPAGGTVGPMALRAGTVYWAVPNQPSGGLTGSLHRAPVAGGSGQVLATGLHDPRAMAVGPQRVWYAGAHVTPDARVEVLGSVAVAGGAGRYAESPVEVTGLACDGDWLYLVGTTRRAVAGVLRRRPA